MNKIILKMNSTFGTIGKATTDKLTEKLTAKTSFRLISVKIFEQHAVTQGRTFAKFGHFLLFSERSFPLIVNETLFLLNFLLRFFHLVAVFVNFRN